MLMRIISKLSLSSILFPFLWFCFIFGFPSRQFFFSIYWIYRRNWKLIRPHIKQNKKFPQKNKDPFFSIFFNCSVQKHFVCVIFHIFLSLIFVFSFHSRLESSNILIFHLLFSFIKLFYKNSIKKTPITVDKFDLKLYKPNECTYTIHPLFSN